METQYDKYDSGGGSSTNDNVELIFTPYSTIETEIGSVFGTDSEFGESLGVTFENVEIIDGCLYADPEKEKYKLFSWKDANDMSPVERLERGGDPSAEDANDFLRKTYAGNEKEYELVGARVQEVTDEDGEVVIEASSRVRDVEFGDEEGEIEFGEFEDIGGDVIEFEHEAISWYGGSTDHGPSVSSKQLAKVLTEYGEQAVADEDDLYNWLHDSSGSNVLREDLEGRRVRFFTVTRSGDKYTYNLPVVLDAETGHEIQVDNYDDTVDETSEAVQEAEEADAGPYPEPIADFIESARDLDMTQERARTLLDDMISDEGQPITAEMVEDVGGREELVATAL